ncbi:hypothetical protein EVAR_93834_1 [Eumeta japonica]|uniref:Tesmin/TSO1-like CXC domain-containing protein n=1 Tax=Eumeta variegata TaxID=151549 RepID=A0A4C1TWN1_EUMVA|nr:hypothetical protein EVAR_93834_1 [Eumeta japonica]
MGANAASDAPTSNAHYRDVRLNPPLISETRLVVGKVNSISGMCVSGSRRRFDGPGCGSASDRVSELNTSGRTGEGRVLMMAVHHQSHFHLLIEASKIDLCKCKGNCGAMCGCRKAGMKCSAVCFHCSERLAAT